MGDELNECLFRLLMTVMIVLLTWRMRICEQSGFALDSEFWCHESYGETFCSADPQVEGRSVLWTWVYSGVVGVLMALQVGKLHSPSQFLFPQALEGMFKDDGDMKHVGDESAGVIVATGSAHEAQDILGERVAVTGGSLFLAGSDCEVGIFDAHSWDVLPSCDGQEDGLRWIKPDADRTLLEELDVVREGLWRFCEFLVEMNAVTSGGVRIWVSPEDAAVVVAVARQACEQYTKTSLNDPMFVVLLEDVSSLGGASVFVNSLTVMGFICATSRKVAMPRRTTMP